MDPCIHPVLHLQKSREFLWYICTVCQKTFDAKLEPVNITPKK